MCSIVISKMKQIKRKSKWGFHNLGFIGGPEESERKFVHCWRTTNRGFISERQIRQADTHSVMDYEKPGSKTNLLSASQRLAHFWRDIARLKLITQSLWLVSIVPVGVQTREKFNLKLTRSEKTLWHEHTLVARVGFWLHHLACH